MSPRSWGLTDGGRINNPVGKTGLFAALGSIVVAVLVILGVDPEITGIVAGGFGLAGAGLAEKVRRQPPEYRNPKT